MRGEFAPRSKSCMPFLWRGPTNHQEAANFGVEEVANFGVEKVMIACEKTAVGGQLPGCVEVKHES